MLDIEVRKLYNILTNFTEGDEFVDRNNCSLFNCIDGYFYYDCFNCGNTTYNKECIKKKKNVKRK